MKVHHTPSGQPQPQRKNRIGHRIQFVISDSLTLTPLFCFPLKNNVQKPNRNFFTKKNCFGLYWMYVLMSRLLYNQYRLEILDNSKSILLCESEAFRQR
jgi:hypothetical protein